MFKVLGIAALVALQVSASAQDVATDKVAGVQEKQAPKVVVAKEAGPSAGLFYKAYYLDKVERKMDAAMKSYKGYLAAAPRGKYSPDAAYSLRQLLVRLDREDEANQVTARFKDVIALRKPSRRSMGNAGGMGRRGNNQADRPDYTAELAKLTKELEATTKSLEGAMANNDQTQIQNLQKKMDKLASQIKNVQRRMERGNRQGGNRQGGNRQGGRRGFGTPLTDMSKEELDTMLERTESMIERFGQMLEPEAAADMEKKFGEFKKLIKAGKLEEAQKMRSEMFSGMRRRRR
jgi:hypothetical protein